MLKTKPRSGYIPWWAAPREDRPWKRSHQFNLKAYRTFLNRRLRKTQNRELQRDLEVSTPRKSRVLWEAF